MTAMALLDKAYLETGNAVQELKIIDKKGTTFEVWVLSVDGWNLKHRRFEYRRLFSSLKNRG